MAAVAGDAPANYPKVVDHIAPCFFCDAQTSRRIFT